MFALVLALALVLVFAFKQQPKSTSVAIDYCNILFDFSASCVISKLVETVSLRVLSYRVTLFPLRLLLPTMFGNTYIFFERNIYFKNLNFVGALK